MITVQDDKKTFVRTLCTLSVTMASLCFIGISVVLIIFYETKISELVGVAYSGVMSVFSFTTASIFALVLMYPKKRSKEEKELILRFALLLFALGWAFFFILISALMWAFSRVPT